MNIVDYTEHRKQTPRHLQGGCGEMRTHVPCIRPINLYNVDDTRVLLVSHIILVMS